MTEVMNIVYLLIVILVPIIPAFLLFKKLKSSAKASGPVGPVKEFSVKFGGAFAAYFPVFLLLYFKLPLNFKKETTNKDIWEINGNVTDGMTNKKITDSELRVILVPSSLVTGGKFKMYLPPALMLGKEKLIYQLQIEDKKGVYLSSNLIDLDDFTDQFMKTRVMNIPDSTLVLYKKSTQPADSLIMEPIKELN